MKSLIFYCSIIVIIIIMMNAMATDRWAEGSVNSATLTTWHKEPRLAETFLGHLLANRYS